MSTTTRLSPQAEWSVEIPTSNSSAKVRVHTIRRKRMNRLIIWAGVAAITLNLLVATHFLKRAGEAIEVKAKYELVLDTPKLNKQKATMFIFSKSSRISYRTATQITDEAWKYKNALLLLAVMEAESEFNPTAYSKAGARGLGQINYKAHHAMLSKMLSHPRDLHNIETNFRATDAILSMYLQNAKGDIEQALAYYLGGRDGKYMHRILLNLSQLYLLTR